MPTVRLTTALVLTATLTAAVAQYPSMRIVPVEPTTDDSVFLHVVLGELGTTCVPAYAGTASVRYQPGHSVTPDVPFGYPPAYAIAVTWGEPTPPDRDTACGPGPSEYGPRIALGRLAPGVYRARATAGPALSFEVRRAGPGPVVGGVVYSACAAYDPRALSGATVVLERVSGDSAGAEAARIDSCVTTVERPYYEFLTDGPALYRLSCTHSDYRPQSVSCAVDEDTVVNIGLVPESPYCSVRGTIRLFQDSLGYVSPQLCRVVVAAADDESTPLATASVGQTGSYQMTVPLSSAEQRIRITAIAPGIDTLSVDTLARCGLTVVQEFTLGSHDGVSEYPRVAVRTAGGLQHRLEVDSVSTHTHGALEVLAGSVVTNVSDTTVPVALHRLCYLDGFPGKHDGGGCWFFAVDVTLADGNPAPWRNGCDSYTCDSIYTVVALRPQESLPHALFDLHIDTLVDSLTLAVWLDNRPDSRVAMTIAPQGVDDIGPKPFPPRAMSFDTDGLAVEQVVPDARTNGPSTRLARDGRHLVLRLTKPRPVSVRLWTLDGRLAAAPLARRHMAAGVHRIPLGPGSRIARPLLLQVRIGEITLTRFVALTPRLYGGYSR